MTLSKGERDDLLKVVRSRTRVLKHAAEARAKDLADDFERQMAAEYKWSQDEVWRTAYIDAESAVNIAKEIIASRCAELGIPSDYAPDVHLLWSKRGENAFRERQIELRRAAKAKIASVEATAKAKIEAAMSDAEVRVYSHGIASDAARALLETIPSVESLMPVVDFKQIAGADGSNKYDWNGRLIENRSEERQ